MPTLFTDFFRTLLRYFRFFWGQSGSRLFGLVAVMLLAAQSEAVGIALFLPVFTPSGGADARLPAMIERGTRALGLPHGIAGTLVLVVAAFALKGVFLFFAGAYQYRISSGITGRLRERLVRALSGVDYRALLDTSTGHLTNAVTVEVARTTHAFMAFARAFSNLITIAVFFAIILLLEWRLTLLVLAAGTGVMLLVRVPASIAHRESRTITGENGALATLLIQAVQGARYLLATASFGALEHKLVSSTRNLARAEYRVGSLLSLSIALAQPLSVAILACALLYQSLVLREALASAFVLMIYLHRILTEIFALQQNWQQFASYTGAIDTVDQALTRLEASAEPSGGASYAGLRERLELRDVSYAYDQSRPVLSHVSVEARRNRTVAFVGESGAGKSTIVDVLTGLLKPTQGVALVDGSDLALLDRVQYRARIGYVSQDPVLFNDSVANNICMWSGDPEHPEVMERIRDSARKARCDEFVQAMPGAYGALVGDRGVKLSGGQRQRLCIARELYKSPEILILDEATSALDSESELAIQQSIDALKGRMTILIIAHRLSTVRNCDRLYVLDAGRVIEEGTFSDLIARPGSRFRRMCELQEVS